MVDVQCSRLGRYLLLELSLIGGYKKKYQKGEGCTFYNHFFMHQESDTSLSATLALPYIQ